MKRGTPLKRKKPLKAKRSKPRRVSVVRDEAHKQAVRELGYCCVAESLGAAAGPCWGAIQCMHLGKRNGMSSKGSDHETAPGCAGHHRMQEDDVGPFRGWSDAQMLEWGLTQVAIAAAKLRIKKHLARIPEVAIPW